MKTVLFITIWLAGFYSFAADPLPQGATPEILKAVSQSNQAQAELDLATGALDTFRTGQVVPFAEFQETGYIFFNDDDFRGYATDIKRILAQNMPANVTLVIYTTSSSDSYAKQVREEYEQYIAKDRLIVLKVPSTGSNDFWSRDNLPIPVWTDNQLTLVDARYYYNFEPDQFLTDLFRALSQKHNYFYEGGNFMANSRGDCIVVNRRRSYPGGTSDTAAIPDAIFKNMYGCQKLTRLKHLKGIGHADEVVKFMTDDIVVTDTDEYVKQLQDLGYTVVKLPEAERAYETYVNSLIVNDVLFVPEFGEPGDAEAVEIFKNLNLGYKIVTAPTRRLATGGQGGIHCITMNYPPVPFGDIVKDLAVTIVE